MIAILGALIASTLRAATPLIFGALGGIFSERSGVVNIALDGIMLTGAWAAVTFTQATGSTTLGIVIAVLIGMLVSLIHAVASIHFKANQVVSGVAINLLAMGFTGFMATRGGASSANWTVAKRVMDIGPFNLTTILALLAVPLTWFVLFKTPWGLRLRSVGEHPKAADTVGVNVYAMRYWGVLLSGLLAGMAGASLSVGLLSAFALNITSGRGYIALAAMIFGRWNPWGALMACLLFGFADALGILFQAQGIAVPSQILNMAPYILTMLALAGFVGRSTPPAASGNPYEKAH